ncbi:uncharacterized protein L969DRAFT_55714 [Mixia osmundae IAM 14324]|uniref:DNA replication checkpoint mediator MRC1 domain-containing protein n=1 Tax=Mixia osmundae (strain CBS 9802 / IAM 14324 / JCM 22182 / KY 12970) TaxID=764103 RepID=G7E2R0_MIXOS|nr:uncharacterized protein L969DRAFT_55714 [Mixia osmundae IAM 14324]KEI36137.1 hypothetical protein L969DRAFT_55714 [Mixia osmundae IAM 14324]GAA97120.1 hypothetical protein E5Q_03795 [Mixia osmundae IAM 14324]
MSAGPSSSLSSLPSSLCLTDRPNAPRDGLVSSKSSELSSVGETQSSDPVRLTASHTVGRMQPRRTIEQSSDSDASTGIDRHTDDIHDANLSAVMRPNYLDRYTARPSLADALRDIDDREDSHLYAESAVCVARTSVAPLQPGKIATVTSLPRSKMQLAYSSSLSSVPDSTLGTAQSTREATLSDLTPLPALSLLAQDATDAPSSSSSSDAAGRDTDRERAPSSSTSVVQELESRPRSRQSSNRKADVILPSLRRKRIVEDSDDDDQDDLAQSALRYPSPMPNSDSESEQRHRDSAEEDDDDDDDAPSTLAGGLSPSAQKEAKAARLADLAARVRAQQGQDATFLNVDLDAELKAAEQASLVTTIVSSSSGAAEKTRKIKRPTKKDREETNRESARARAARYARMQRKEAKPLRNSITSIAEKLITDASPGVVYAQPEKDATSPVSASSGSLAARVQSHKAGQASASHTKRTERDEQAQSYDPAYLQSQTQSFTREAYAQDVAHLESKRHIPQTVSPSKGKGRARDEPSKTPAFAPSSSIEYTSSINHPASTPLTTARIIAPYATHEVASPGGVGSLDADADGDDDDELPDADRAFEMDTARRLLQRQREERQASLRKQKELAARAQHTTAAGDEDDFEIVLLPAARIDKKERTSMSAYNRKIASLKQSRELAKTRAKQSDIGIASDSQLYKSAKAFGGGVDNKARRGDSVVSSVSSHSVARSLQAKASQQSRAARQQKQAEWASAGGKLKVQGVKDDAAEEQTTMSALWDQKKAEAALPQADDDDEGEEDADCEAAEVPSDEDATILGSGSEAYDDDGAEAESQIGAPDSDEENSEIDKENVPSSSLRPQGPGKRSENAARTPLVAIDSNGAACEFGSPSGGFTQLFSTAASPSDSNINLFDKPSTAALLPAVSLLPALRLDEAGRREDAALIEAQAPFINQQVSPEEILERRWLNKEGLLTQHQPHDVFAASPESPSEYFPPGSRPYRAPGTTSPVIEQRRKLTRILESASTSPLAERQRTMSRSEVDQTTGGRFTDAFGVMKDAAARQAAPKPTRPRLEKSDFIDDGAIESEEEDGGMLRRDTRDDEEDEEDDDAGSVQEMFDDEKRNEEDEVEDELLVRKKFAEVAEQDDAKALKLAQAQADGKWRSKRREGDYLSDEDYSDEEFGRADRPRIIKKRKVEGDLMETISADPKTASFAQTYNGGLHCETKEEDVAFLEPDDMAGLQSDEEGNLVQRVKGQTEEDDEEDEDEEDEADRNFIVEDEGEPRQTRAAKAAQVDSASRVLPRSRYTSVDPELGKTVADTSSSPQTTIVFQDLQSAPKTLTRPSRDAFDDIDLGYRMAPSRANRRDNSGLYKKLDREDSQSDNRGIIIGKSSSVTSFGKARQEQRAGSQGGRPQPRPVDGRAPLRRQTSSQSAGSRSQGGLSGFKRTGAIVSHKSL